MQLTALTADATLTILGKDENGDEVSEDVTIASGARSSATTDKYAGKYAMEITPANFNGESLAVSVASEAMTVDDGMTDLFFPILTLDLNELADVREIPLISSVGAASASVIGQRWGQFNFNTAILVEELPLILRGQVNPSGVTSDVIPTQPDTPVTLSIPANGDVTIPAIVTNRPSRMIFTFATLPGSGGTLTIRGAVREGNVDNNKRTKEEIIKLSNPVPGTTRFESENFYQVDANNPIVVTSSGVTAPVATLKYDSELFLTVFRIQRADPQFIGYTVQGLVGGVPIVGYGVVPSLMTFASDDTMTIDVQCVAEQVHRQRTVQDGDVRRVKMGVDYTLAKEELYGGWAGSFSYGGNIVKYTGLSIPFDRRYEADDAKNADRYRTDLIKTENRLSLFNVTARFQSGDELSDVFANWQEIFRNDDRSALKFSAYYYSKYGQRRRMIIDSPNSQLNEAPQIVVNSPGPIDEPLAFKALSNAAGDSELVITLETLKDYTV